MRRDGWSLSGRLARLFVALTTLTVVAIIGVGYFFVRYSVHRHVDALLTEKLDGYHVQTRGEFDPEEAFDRVTRLLADGHPENALAWRLCCPDGEVRQVGHAALARVTLPAAEDALATEGPERGVVEGHVWWAREEVAPGYRMELLLDASPQVSLIEYFQLASVLAVIGSALVSLLIGGVYLRRVSRLLRRVADGARRVQRKDSTIELALDADEAPEEIREVADALSEMLAKIREESRNARLMLAGIAHELRSPIQNLVGETEVVLLKERDGTAYRETLHSHLQELRDLGDAIDNLITMCHAEVSPRGSEREELDLQREAELRLERERAHADLRGTRLEIEYHGDLAMSADREELLRALRNLVSNAIEWSSSEGRVEVRLDGRGEELVLTVDDDGPGIPLPLRERIFDPFFRGPQREGQRIGYGLGLAMTRHAVTDHGGSIAIEDSHLGGARFVLRLPRRATPPASPATGEEA